MDDRVNRTPPRPPLFESLDPPPGGLDRLRAALRSRGRRRRAVRVGTLGGLAAGVAAALVVVLHHRAPDRWDIRSVSPNPELVRLGLQPKPEEPATVPPDLRDRMALQRVPLGIDDVVYYRVAILPDVAPNDQAAATIHDEEPPGGAE